MYAVDLHSHTRFFHGFESRSTAFDPIGARLLTAFADRRGLDGLAVTNHDYRYLPDARRSEPARSANPGSTELVAAEVETESTGGDASASDGVPGEPVDSDATSGEPVDGDAIPGEHIESVAIPGEPLEEEAADEVIARRGSAAARADDSGLMTIPGIEITTSRGHLLVVGPDPPAVTKPGVLTPDEAIDLAHDRDCAAIIPHPFRASTVRETEATVDAVEVNGKHTHHRERVALLAEGRDCPIVGGSDAHYPFEVGRAFTLVDAEELTPQSVVDAIRDGRVEPAVRLYRLDRLLTPAYRLIHRLKGHLPIEDDATRTRP